MDTPDTYAASYHAGNGVPTRHATGLTMADVERAIGRALIADPDAQLHTINAPSAYAVALPDGGTLLWVREQ